MAAIAKGAALAGRGEPPRWSSPAGRRATEPVSARLYNSGLRCAYGDNAIVVRGDSLDGDLVACAETMSLKEVLPGPAPEPEELVVRVDVRALRADEPFEVQLERCAPTGLLVVPAD